MDKFDFDKNFFVASNLNSVPLKAQCSRFITQVDMSFDAGVTWMSASDYDTSAKVACGQDGFSVTLSNSRAPWKDTAFVSGQTAGVKFRALSRAGYYVYRDIVVQYTPSGLTRQEILIGTNTSTSSGGGGLILKSRVRAQRQDIASGGGLLLRSRILE